ncbi:glycogen biosynthesis protein GlgD [Neobacillus sp. OS1-2]|uniref:glycogen biosynthesis protein GlgD n=1 Tax=Neobacillus sp. OS1-2 TaxID=3070680 RepID=UPI0027DF321E|nr:glycogen biosynthesis protein GlgD [Neobacillus sp. OS1-2]WML40906.1 glycogen biosynthesis protein GlgD [Neobacillus sp. OS1-2]
MKKRSKQQNPEQTTRNGINNQDLELGQDVDLVKLAKKKYEQSGGQPVKSKMHPE